MSTSEYLWYIPNQIASGHRGDVSAPDHNSLETLTEHAKALEQNGWKGALIGTGWGRPDTFTLAAALTARTTSFEPLIAIRPGYWRPANFASAAATLDHLSGGRVRINIVSEQDNLGAYGDSEGDQVQRYGRTREFMRLWTEEDVTHDGEYFQLTGTTVVPRLGQREGRSHPRLYFGGASAAAEHVAATEADVQLFWGEPLDGVEERIARLKTLSRQMDRDLPPLQFGLRITTFIRDTTELAWADAEAKVEAMATHWNERNQHRRKPAVGQQRLLDLHTPHDVIDDNLYTAPGKFGSGGAGTTWLVGSAEDVARSLLKYQALGIRHFVLSDTPYLPEISRQGSELLPLLRAQSVHLEDLDSDTDVSPDRLVLQ